MGSMTEGFIAKNCLFFPHSGYETLNCQYDCPIYHFQQMSFVYQEDIRFRYEGNGIM